MEKKAGNQNHTDVDKKFHSKSDEKVLFKDVPVFPKQVKVDISELSKSMPEKLPNEFTLNQ